MTIAEGSGPSVTNTSADSGGEGPRSALGVYDARVHGVTNPEPALAREREWRAEFEAARRRPLEQRMRYAFVRTYKPVLDDARFRSFDSMEQYRDWCRRELPSWLGYGRV